MTYPRPGGASRLPLHAVAAARPALDPNHKHRKKRLKKSQQHKTAKSAGRLTKRPQTGWHRQKCSKHMGQMTRGECICLYIYINTIYIHIYMYI